MTTLFNLFCPFCNLVFSVEMKGLLLVGVSVVLVFSFMSFLLTSFSNFLSSMKEGLFPLNFKSEASLFSSMFVLLSLLNLSSLVIFSYPVTTTLSFNLSLALSLWLSAILLILVKVKLSSTVLPSGSPWYLIPFLSLVELISVLVRPVTLSFRLLANMSAGHILLTLISKMGVGWVLGSVFMLLELMVCMVQAFVLVMLISVYLEESVSH